MDTAPIRPIVMPKWGLSMKEGKVVAWLVEAGTAVSVGDEVMEVETDKIDGTVEATDGGVLRRLVAEVGHVYPVKALLAVLADDTVSEEAIDEYVAAFAVPIGEDDTAEEESPYATVEVDGITVRYARQGSGERTVVLLHGFGGDLDNWLFTIGPLAEVADVVALDLPGHGQSSLALPGPSVKALAGFVARFLDLIGVTDADVVGHSLGGAIATQLALDRPELVRSLALIAPAGLGDEIDGDYLTAFVTAQTRRQVKPVLERLFADGSLVTRPMIEGVLRYKRLDGAGELLEALRAGVFPEGRQAARPGDRLGAVGVPVLVVWGRDDAIIPARHVAAAPANATVVVLDGAGHMVQMEKAHEVNEALLAHLS